MHQSLLKIYFYQRHLKKNFRNFFHFDQKNLQCKNLSIKKFHQEKHSTEKKNHHRCVTERLLGHQ